MGAAPQFKLGDRVSAQGIVREVSDQPGSTALIVVFEGAEHKPLTLFPDRLTLVPATRCERRFPGDENTDGARCSLDDGHEDLRADLRGWRWRAIEQRTDDAHAPAEPRCEAVRPAGFPLRCWGMDGHVGKHRTPSGEWT